MLEVDVEEIKRQSRELGGQPIDPLREVISPAVPQEPSVAPGERPSLPDRMPAEPEKVPA